ncbi:MAG: flagellar motor switch protein FliM [Rickettsiales bacterium]|nr:flagellar motor switch protein FliM [Rickettsiales bacterium]
MGSEENKNNQEDAMASMIAEMGNAEDKTEAQDADMSAMLETQGTLSQDEIDSLLGFGGEATIPERGVEALIYRTVDNYEKFPMLEVIFDRFSRSVSSTLRSFTGEVSEISVLNIGSVKFEDYLNTIPLPTMINVFQATEWENLGLITIESSLVYRLVDILLGGGKGKASFRIEGRPFTTIEQDIISNFCKLILEEVSSAFTPVTTVTFKHDRLETNPRFAAITRPQNPVVIITCNIEFDGDGGKIDIIFPYQTLEPVKDQLMQMFSGESFGSDLSWENYLSDEIISSKVNVQATLKPITINLNYLANLKVGSTLVSNNKHDDILDINCNGISLLSGKLGALEDKLAISIT